MRKNIILWILEIALGVLGSIAVFWGYSSMNIFTLYGVLFVPGLLTAAVYLYLTINEQISNFAQTYPTNLKASSNEALLFMRRYRFANCSCFSCCFKDAYPSSNVQ